MRISLLFGATAALSLAIVDAGCSSSSSGGTSAGSGGASVTGSGGTQSGGSGGAQGGGSGGAPGASGGSGGSNGTGGSIAGSGGSTATDASADSPANGIDGSSSAACPGVTAKYCEDYEGQTAGMPPMGDFTISGPAGAIVVDATKAFSGTKSMHIKLPKPAPTAQLTFTKQFPLNDYYGRVMMWMTAVPTNDNHWDFLYSYTTVNGKDLQWEIGGQFQGFALVVDPPDHALYPTKPKVPLGSWYCLQWRFKYGGAGMDNTLAVKVNGAALEKGNFTGADSAGMKWGGGPWRDFTIGWTEYPEASSNVDIEMWIDDLAFGEQEIACPAMAAQ